MAFLFLNKHNHNSLIYNIYFIHIYLFTKWKLRVIKTLTVQKNIKTPKTEIEDDTRKCYDLLY